ncbi:MAG: hypothetical protein ACREI8_13815 [Myxococcota bacterium]
MGSEPDPDRGVVFFFDRSVGKAVPTALRQVGVAVEIHDDLYGSAVVPDEQWIREATERGSVLVTRDRRIRRRPAERGLAVEMGARMFVLGGNATRLAMLRALMIAWEEIRLVCEAEAPPFIYTVTSRGSLVRLHG